MVFENNQIFSDQIPDVEHIIFQPLHPTYKKVMLFSRIITSIILILMGIASYFLEIFTGIQAIISGIFILIIAVFYIVIIKMAFSVKGYAMRRHDAVYKTGIWFKRTTTIPFSRIQHVAVTQGLFSRLFGLAKLNLYNASGTRSEFTIPGLLLDEAEKMKSFVMEYKPTDEQV